MKTLILAIVMSLTIVGCAKDGDSPVPNSQASWGERYGEDVPNCLVSFPDDDAYVVPCPELDGHQDEIRSGGGLVVPYYGEVPASPDRGGGGAIVPL